MLLIRFIFMITIATCLHATAWSSSLCHEIHNTAIDPEAMLVAKNLDPQKLAIHIDPIDSPGRGYVGQVRIFYNGKEVFWGKIYETSAALGLGRIIINTGHESFPHTEFKGLGLASLAYFTVAEYFYRTKELVLTSDDFYKGELNDTLTLDAQKQWDRFQNRGYLTYETPSGRYGQFDPAVIKGLLFEKVREFSATHLIIKPHDPIGVGRK